MIRKLRIDPQRARVAARFCTLAAALWLAVPSTRAQLETGQISGIVTGVDGARLSGARVQLTDSNTGSETETASNASGFYAFPDLAPGEWRLRSYGPGGAQAEIAIAITPGEKVSANIAFSTGAGRILVQPAMPALQYAVTPALISELPSLTRNPYDFIATLPNASPTDPSGLGAGFAFNGLRATGGHFLLDGVDNNDEFSTQIGQRTPQESVKEFAVTMGSFTAEYGRGSAAVINVVTRTGTDQFHGAAYEFNRIAALASNGFFNNANRIAQGIFDRNQFGYSVGGPAIRNKLFFFQNTEWVRVRSKAVETALVPSAQLIAASAPATQAFFSAYGSLRPGLAVIHTFTRAQLNPCTRNATVLDPCFAFPAGAPMLNEVAYSVPSDLGAGSPQNTYSLVGNVDYVWDEKTRVSARYALYSEDDFAGSLSSSPYSGYDTGQSFFDNRFSLSAVRSWSPSWTSQTRLAFTRLSNRQPPGSNPPGPSLYMNTSATVALEGQLITLPGYSPYSPGVAVPAGGPQNIAIVAHDATKTWRSHDFHFGGQFTYIQDNRAFGAYEEAAEGLGTTVGNALDGFLTGQLHDFTSAINPQGKFRGQTINLPAVAPSFSRSNRFRDSTLYAQDTWKLKPRLTVSLGLRWDYFGVQHNVDSRLDSNFYTGSTTLPQQIATGAVYTVPTSPGKQLYKPDWRDFAPRAGVAYDIFGDGSTTFRAGYGIVYDKIFGNLTFNIIQNPPNYQVISLVAGADLPSIPIQTSNSGPLGAAGTQVLAPSLLRAINDNIATAYAHLFNASLERRLGTNTAATLSYSASLGEKLYSVSDFNPTGAGNIYLNVPCTAGSLGYPGTCTARINSQYSDIDLRTNGGESNYNAAIARLVTRNFWKTGITLDANYTWSHAIDNLSSAFSYSPHGNYVLGFLDPFDPALDRGNSDFDIRHHVAVSGIWRIPSFKRPAFLERLVGGWVIAPIFTARTGSPFTLYDCGNAYNFCPRAETAGKLPRRGVTNVPSAGVADNYQYYAFPTALTSQAGVWYNPKDGLSDFGPFPSNMLRRNTFYATGSWNVDAGIYKETRVRETMSLELRLELYNAFNHANFIVNTADTDVSSFSAVDGYFNGTRNVQLGARLTF